MLGCFAVPWWFFRSRIGFSVLVGSFQSRLLGCRYSTRAASVGEESDLSALLGSIDREYWNSNEQAFEFEYEKPAPVLWEYAGRAHSVGCIFCRRKGEEEGFSVVLGEPSSDPGGESKASATRFHAQLRYPMSSSQKWMSFLSDTLLEEESQSSSGLFWNSQPAPPCDPVDCCIENDCSRNEPDEAEKACAKKRSRGEHCAAAGSKACREKMRRDRLNDRFLELSAALEPGRPPKTDKATILSDAVRVITQLRAEAQQLKESNQQLRTAIKDLKAEKNDLRDEKQRLKSEKERLEQQLKVLAIPPAGFMPHPAAAMHAAALHAFHAQTQAASNKNAAATPGFPGMAMWQWMPPAAIDTSQDHVLRPPVA